MVSTFLKKGFLMIIYLFLLILLLPVWKKMKMFNIGDNNIWDQFGLYLKVWYCLVLSSASGKMDMRRFD